MRKIFVVAAAILAVSAFVVSDADAMPIAPVDGFASGDTTLVRDGCGRGMRFSERRGRCVPDEDRDVAVCPRGFRWSDGRQRCVPEVRVREACPPGFRFSERRERCVPGF
jgi:hypothetical protein